MRHKWFLPERSPHPISFKKRGVRLALLAAAAVGFSGLFSITVPQSVSAACVINVAPNDVLNLRSGASSRTSIVGFISPSRCGVRILRRSGNWGYVTWRGRQGWANLRYIGEGDEGDGAIGGGVVTGCVVNVALNDVLNMRSRPTASSRIVSYLRPSECGVRVLSTRGRWVRVNSGGATGWVNGRYFNY